MDFLLFMNTLDQEKDENNNLLFTESAYRGINWAYGGELSGIFSFEELLSVVKKVDAYAYKESLKLSYPPKFLRLVNEAINREKNKVFPSTGLSS